MGQVFLPLCAETGLNQHLGLFLPSMTHKKFCFKIFVTCIYLYVCYECLGSANAHVKVRGQIVGIVGSLFCHVGS